MDIIVNTPADIGTWTVSINAFVTGYDFSDYYGTIEFIIIVRDPCFTTVYEPTAATKANNIHSYEA